MTTKKGNKDTGLPLEIMFGDSRDSIFKEVCEILHISEKSLADRRTENSINMLVSWVAALRAGATVDVTYLQEFLREKTELLIEAENQIAQLKRIDARGRKTVEGLRDKIQKLKKETVAAQNNIEEAARNLATAHNKVADLEAKNDELTTLLAVVTEKLQDKDVDLKEARAELQTRAGKINKLLKAITAIKNAEEMLQRSKDRGRKPTNPNLFKFKKTVSKIIRKVMPTKSE